MDKVLTQNVQDGTDVQDGTPDALSTFLMAVFAIGVWAVFNVRYGNYVVLEQMGVAAYLPPIGMWIAAAFPSVSQLYLSRNWRKRLGIHARNPSVAIGSVILLVGDIVGPALGLLYNFGYDPFSTSFVGWIVALTVAFLVSVFAQEVWVDGVYTLYRRFTHTTTDPDGEV